MYKRQVVECSITYLHTDVTFYNFTEVSEVCIREIIDIKIVGNTMTFRMMKQFFDFDVDQHAIVVKEGDTLETRCV